MCGPCRTTQPDIKRLLNPSAVRGGAKGFMVQRRNGGNGEKRMSACDPIADVEMAANFSCMLSWLREKLRYKPPMSQWAVSIANDCIVTKNGTGA